MAALVGAFGAEKPCDEETQALFSSPAALAAIGAKLGHAVQACAVATVSTLVVAGLKYRAAATLTGEGGAQTRVSILAFKPLPHTNLPLDIQEVTTVA